MSTTVRDLIKASLRLIGASASGETPAADEINDAFSSLNRMLSSWSTSNLNIYAKVREEFSLTPGSASFTMGPTGDFNTTRPINIEAVAIEMQSTTPAVEIPLTVRNVSEWASIPAKDLQGMPTDIFFSGSFPLETVNLYPVPSTADKLVIYSLKPLASFTTVGDTVSLPPGYEDAIVYNLAVRLAPEYGRAVDQLVFQTAQSSKAAIQKRNSSPQYLKIDTALPRASKANIFAGK